MTLPRTYLGRKAAPHVPRFGTWRLSGNGGNRRERQDGTGFYRKRHPDALGQHRCRDGHAALFPSRAKTRRIVLTAVRSWRFRFSIAQALREFPEEIFGFFKHSRLQIRSGRLHEVVRASVVLTPRVRDEIGRRMARRRPVFPRPTDKRRPIPAAQGRFRDRGVRLTNPSTRRN